MRLQRPELRVTTEWNPITCDGCGLEEIDIYNQCDVDFLQEKHSACGGSTDWSPRGYLVYCYTCEFGVEVGTEAEAADVAKEHEQQGAGTWQCIPKVPDHPRRRVGRGRRC